MKYVLMAILGLLMFNGLFVLSRLDKANKVANIENPDRWDIEQ